MKILFVARRCWPALGGIETFMRELMTELGSRHEITVLSARVDDGAHTRLTDSLRPPPTFSPFSTANAHVTPLQVSVPRRIGMSPLVAHATPVLRRYAYGRSRVAAGALVARMVGPVIAEQARGFDVIHMWSGDLLASAAVRAGELAGIPVVITPFAHEGQWGYDPASLRAYGRAARVAALLETEARFYSRLGLDPGRVDVVGVPNAGVTPIPPESARRQLGIDGPLVLFLGGRRPYKGFDLLLRAAPAVTSAFPRATFAFVGPGPRLDDVPAGCDIRDVGAVSEEEKAVWLSAAHVMCLPSEAEILPSSILEAWSVGTPVLTSDIPALSELVDGSGGGRCVKRDSAEIATALIDILGDPARLAAMGERGRHTWLTRYTPSEVGRRHEAMYATAIAGTGRHPDIEEFVAAAGSGVPTPC
jgi:glycosyltransferase involved in cell wall biosynthesis